MVLALGALPAELARCVRAFLSFAELVRLVAGVEGLGAWLPTAAEVAARVGDSALALRSERRATSRAPARATSCERATCVYHDDSLRRLLLANALYDGLARAKMDATEALQHLERDRALAQRVAIEILSARAPNRYARARARLHALRNALDDVVAWFASASIAYSPQCFHDDLMEAYCGYDGLAEESALCHEVMELAQRSVESYRLALTAAAHKGRLDLVRRLVHCHALVNPVTLESALRSAADAGRQEVVDALLQAASTRDMEIDVTESLICACKRGHRFVVEGLLASHQTSFSSVTHVNVVLQAAVTSGDLDIVAHILADSRINAWDPLSLQQAAGNSDLGILQLLLRHPSCRKGDVELALRSLARANSYRLEDQSKVVLELVTNLTDRGLDPSTCWEVIDLACAHGNVAAIERALGLISNHSENSYRKYWRPLVTAARHGHDEIVRRILEARGCWRALSVAKSLDGDTEMAEALLAACCIDDLSTAKLLLHRVDVDLLQLLRIIEAAAAAPTCSVLRWMLVTQPDTVSNCDLDAALQYACAHGRASAARLLLMEAKLRFGDGQAIQFAATSGAVDVVRLLLDDPRVDVTYDLEAALVDASREGRAAVVVELLNDPRLRITTGAAFHAAAEHGHLHVLRILMGAEVMWHNPPILELHVAYSRATRRGHYDVVLFLLSDVRVPLPRGGALTRVADLPKRPADPVWCMFLRRFFRHRRVDPTADSNQLLLDACLQGQRGVVDALLRCGRVQASSTAVEAVKDLVRLSNGSVVRVPRRLARRYPLIAADLEKHQHQSKRSFAD